MPLTILSVQLNPLWYEFKTKTCFLGVPEASEKYIKINKNAAKILIRYKFILVILHKWGQVFTFDFLSLKLTS